LHLVGCLYYLYQWCTVKQISDNEIYLLIKYIKRVLWRVAKRLSYIEDAQCLKVNNCISSFSFPFVAHKKFNSKVKSILKFSLFVIFHLKTIMTGPMFFQVVPALQFLQFVFKFVTGIFLNRIWTVCDCQLDIKIKHKKGLEQQVDIWCPHTTDYEDCCLLGCYMVYFGRYVPSYCTVWFHSLGSNLGCLDNLRCMCLTCVSVTFSIFHHTLKH